MLKCAYGVAVCVIIVSLLLCVRTAAADEVRMEPLPPKLIAAIESTIPGASIVRAEDIDPIGCGPRPASPGVVRGNLAGHRRTDFALLLKTKETGKQTVWEGRTFREAAFALVLFTDDGRGNYRARQLTAFTENVPLGALIRLEPAGSLRDISSGRKLATNHAAVALTFCEKSEVAYYLEGLRVHAVWLAD